MSAKAKCGARVTRRVSEYPSIHLVNNRLVLGPPEERWWCDVAHTHPTKEEAIDCNRATVLVNRLHATHGHGHG